MTWRHLSCNLLLRMDWAGLDVGSMVTHLLHLAIAFALALPVGWERERSPRNLGMRTFPLIAMTSCGFLLLGQSVAEGNPDANARVLQGAITGIGFLGGGAIVKRGLTVHGTSTAAAIWATAAIGASVAYQLYEIAVALALTTFATLRWLELLTRVTSTGGRRDPRSVDRPQPRPDDPADGDPRDDDPAEGDPRDDDSTDDDESRMTP